MNAIEVSDLTRSINNREPDIEALESRTKDHAHMWLSEVILQGADLNKLKVATPHGDWMTLFDTGRLKLTYHRAARYMRIASNLARVPNIEAAHSLREALALCEDNTKDTPSRTTQQWPAHTEGINRTSKLVQYFAKHELSTWPAPCLDRLREQFQPIVSRLWPEKFAGPPGSI